MISEFLIRKSYYRPGPRQTRFLGREVTKQHHTLTQILNPLPQLGFRLTAVEEAMPPETMQAELPDEMRRPMMLLVSAVKENPDGWIQGQKGR